GESGGGTTDETGGESGGGSEEGSDGEESESNGDKAYEAYQEMLEEQEAKSLGTWELGDFAGDWAKNVNMTFGVTAEGIVGFNTEYILGGNIETVFSPWAFLGAIPGLPGAVAAGATGALADFNFVLGNYTELVYGAEVGIVRGQKYELHTGLFHGWTSAAIGVCAALYTACYTAQLIVPGLMSNKSKSLAADFGLFGVCEIILMVINTIETVSGFTHAAAEKLKQADHLAAAVISLTPSTNKDILKAAKTSLESAVGYAATMASQAKSAAAEASKLASAALKDVGDNGYTVNCGNMCVNASGVGWMDLLGGADPTASFEVVAASSIGDGLISLSAGSSFVAKSGLGSVQINSPIDISTVTVDCGATGSIFLQSGLLKTPSLLSMEPTGIKIQSLEKITLQAGLFTLVLDAVEGFKVTVGVNTLQLTPTQFQSNVNIGNFLVLNAEGFRGTCLDNSVSATEQGVSILGTTVSATAEASMSLTSPASVSVKTASMSVMP
ncbi:MAG: hypothetical protein ACRDD1_06815, partial [Planctomycetia bacterium]